MRFRPCIDLHNGQVKQIVGGSLSDNDQAVKTNFVSDHDSAYYAKMYRRDGLTGGHVIMLGPGNMEAAKQALAAYPGGLQVGGGITAGNAQEWLKAGAAQVIVTSYIFNDGRVDLDRLKEIFDTTGREKLVLDLSCRKRGDGNYYIVTDRWQKFTDCRVDEENLAFFAHYCTEFLVHAVDVEGKQSGIDRELLQLLSNASPIPCVYAGGIAAMTDIDLIRSYGHGRIDYTVGSALDIFGGKMPYKSLINLQ